MAKKTKEQPATAVSDLKRKFESRIGYSSESLRDRFERKGGLTLKDTKSQDLVELISARIVDTRTINFRSARLWFAVDKAMREPLNSITPTMLRHLLASCKGGDQIDEELAKGLKAWGMTESEVFSYPTVNGQKQRVLQQHKFWDVHIPLARTYVNGRAAKLFEQLDNNPLFAYQPADLTEINRLQCEMWTSLVDRLVVNYGWRARMRQALIQAGQYCNLLAFFNEVWHLEEYRDGDNKKRTHREGLRLHFPHPTQMGFDPSYPLHTFNTDTGCEWALFWTIVPYRVIKSGEFWNKEDINFGTAWPSPGMSNMYFKEVYPCRMKWPADVDQWRTSPDIQKQRYTSNESDRAVFLTNKWMKLIPKDWGWSDYDCPVWNRIVVASDNTVVYIEPAPASGVFWLGWDADESKEENPSLAMEILPHQDQLGNLLAHANLATRQNLMKIVPFDQAQVTKEEVEELSAASSEFSRVHFFGYDSRKHMVKGLDSSKMFTPIQFPLQNVADIIQCISVVVNMMERLEGISANESGTTGTHITTAKETTVIEGANQSRLGLTASYRDDFVDALKRRVPEFMLAFMDDDYATDVTDATDEGKAALKKIGFTVGETIGRKTKITGKREHLDITALATSREGAQRINMEKVASLMMQFLQAAAPFLADGRAETRDHILSMIDRIAQVAGVPRDYKLASLPAPEAKPTGPRVNPDVIERIYKDAPDDVKRQIEQVFGLKPSQMPPVDAALQKVGTQIQQGAVQAAVSEVSKGMQAQGQQMMQVMQQLKAELDKVAQGLQQNFQMDQQEKDQITQALAGMQQVIAKVAQQAAAPPQPQPVMVPPPQPPQPPTPEQVAGLAPM